MRRSYRFLLYAAGIVALVAAIIVLFTALDDGGGRGEGKDPSQYPYAAQKIEPLESRQHLAPGETFDGYNSDPPTSGPHSPNFQDWGVSETAVPSEVAVHNMEHAGVIVWYDCNAGPRQLSADECGQLRGGLADIVQEAVDDGKFVLMTPYPGMDHRIALTAWAYLDAFDELDAARVRSFIDVFECLTDLENLC